MPFRSQHEDGGFYRMRMWAQYAANHSGVCLVLNRESPKRDNESPGNSEIVQVLFRPCSLRSD